MAQRAADLIEDGDSILFDASTTVYHLAECLQDRRDLTVITNGVEISRSLAQNPSATVILLGGVMRTDGTSVTGPISEHVLKDLHVKTAFVSASGIALESGLYEVDIDEAQLKRKMITAASRVVALIDSSKFGKVDLTPFARLDQIAHFFVDDGLSVDWIDRLQQAGVSFTICGEGSATDYSPPLEADSAGGSGVPVSERFPLFIAWSGPTHMIESILRLTNISKSFAGVHALRGVQLELRPGEVHALLGENGAGKSTLVKVMTGVHQPDTGEIYLDGRQIQLADPREATALGISAIYQELSIFPDLDIAENIFAGRQPTLAGGVVDWRRLYRGGGAAAPFAGGPPEPQHEGPPSEYRPAADGRDRPGAFGERAHPDHGRADLGADPERSGRPVPDRAPPARERHGHPVHLAPARRALRDRRSRHGAARWRLRGHPADGRRHAGRADPHDGWPDR